MKISVIIVNFNNSQLTINCINSLLKQKMKNDLSIIVVDNNSTGEEKEILKKYCSTTNGFMDIIFLPQNIGYFPAIVEGQKVVYDKAEYDYMILANNDLIFEADFMEKLQHLTLPDNIMVISPDIITVDGIHQNPHFINRYTFFRRLMYRIYYSNFYISIILDYLLNMMDKQRNKKNKVGYNNEQIIYLGFGACFILTKSFMKLIQFVDDRVFLMGEEQLLTHQVEQVGGKILYLPSLKVNHLSSATLQQMPSKFSYECMKKSFSLWKQYM